MKRALAPMLIKGLGWFPAHMYRRLGTSATAYSSPGNSYRRSEVCALGRDLSRGTRDDPVWNCYYKDWFKVRLLAADPSTGHR